MKKVFGKLIAIVMTMAMIVGVLALTACNDDKDKGVDGTYTCTITGAMGNDDFTLTLTNGKDAQMNIRFMNGQVNDAYFGTYTAEGNEVSVKGLTSETAQSPHPGLWGDLIHTDSGDCEVTLNTADKTFTFKSTGQQGGIPGPIGGEDDWKGGEIKKAVKYVAGGTDSQTMDVFVPTTTETALPLLVTIHGGAFKMGDSAMMKNVYGYFRDKGFVCASLNYTLGEATYPQGVVDCKTAVQYLVDHATEYKIDTSKIAVMGESAGSTIASLVALSKASDFKATGAEDYTFSVNTYIDFYGPISNGNANIGTNVDSGVNAWLGTNNTAVDLSTYLTGMFSCKNIWMQHGDADMSVNKAHAELFKAAIDAYNEATTIPPAKINNVHYEILAGANHMDDKFYTDKNLGDLYDWLCDVYGIATAEVTATYSYELTSTNPMTQQEVTDIFELKLYSDGSCTLGIPAGNEMVKGSFKGSYTLEGTTLTVTGLANVPAFGYTFVAEGGFTATVNTTANTFTPNTAA